MFSNQVHSAILQVKELRRQVLDRQRFRGYSDKARALSGVGALATAVAIAALGVEGPYYHLAFWIGLFLFALVVNYGAVTYWFLNDPHVRRDLRKLKPTIDVFPPLVVGAILSLAIVLRGDFSYLFGTWMCMFGLANLASRFVLPRPIAYVGLYYVAAGVVCLLLPQLSFTNPWPMGLVFFIGETLSGLILRVDQRRNIP